MTAASSSGGDTASTDVTARFHAYGNSFDLCTDDPELLAEAIARVRALGWTDASDVSAVGYVLRHASEKLGAPPTFTALCDGELIARGTDRDEMLNAFENHAKLQTADGATSHVFVHAGAVAWHGRGLLLPGPSRAGKSTLVKALVELGALYYSDEYALLDRDGRLHPYPVSLSLRTDGTAARRIPVEALGGTAGRDGVPVALVVNTSYRRGASWQPRPMSPSAAFLALMANTVAARRPPERTMPTLGATVVAARAFETDRDEAEAAAHALLAELS